MYVVEDNETSFRGQTKIKSDLIKSINNHPSEFDTSNIKKVLDSLPITASGFMYAVNIQMDAITITIGTLHNVYHKSVHAGGFVIDVTDKGESINAGVMVSDYELVTFYTLSHGEITLDNKIDYKTMTEYYATSKLFTQINDIDVVKTKMFTHPIKTNKRYIKEAILSLSTDTYSNTCNKFKITMRGGPETAMMHGSDKRSEVKFTYRSCPIITGDLGRIRDVNLEDILDSIDEDTVTGIKKISNNELLLSLVKCSNQKKPVIYKFKIENEYAYDIKEVIKRNMMDDDRFAEFYLPALKQYYKDIEQRLEMKENNEL